MSVSPGPPGSPLPTGAVTFLFSDIEGSTQRWDAHPEAMQDALRRHDAVMRAAIAQHRGNVFKTIGDAFCAVFDRPQEAVSGALAAQRALAGQDFSAVGGMRARMAIHTGTADERDGDYFGPSVNRVARLLAIGHGGQVLASGVTSDLVQGALPPQTSLRDLGEHRLRDLARPERVYQLIAPDLPAEFSALRSLDVLPNNLPLQATSFVGRDTEVAEITAFLEQHRLVTLVGSGGIGKTRTSLEVAANLLPGSGDGVWFIELAPLSNGDYIPFTVAQAMSLTLAADGDPVANLVSALTRQHCLLVFDNCEHLVESAARVISSILRGCPKVTVLASSRQGLGIAAEEIYRLPSLGVPPENDPLPLRASDAVQSAAITLFVERGRSVNKRFELTDENAPVVADICRRLDGIPLAIELASARVTMLSPHQLRDRLDERFRVLTGGSRDAFARQQTLRAMIDWSHELLDERERALFRRLAIFVNGFTLESAAHTGSGEKLDHLDVFDVLASLVDKSLVLAEPDGDSLRYRLLESTRAYGLEKLEQAGERALVATRHLRNLRDRFKELLALRQRTSRDVELNTALRNELEDVRAALDGALSRSDTIEGAELLEGTWMVWLAIGLETEGIARYETYLASLPVDESRLMGQLSATLSFMLSAAGRKIAAVEVANNAITFARKSGDLPALAWALRGYAYAQTLLNSLDDAEAALAEAEAIPGTLANLRLSLLVTRAMLMQIRGDRANAGPIFDYLRREHRLVGSTRVEMLVTALHLAEIEHARGQTSWAITLVQDELPAQRSRADAGQLAVLLENLAGYIVAADDVAGAVVAAREAIAIRAMREPTHTKVGVPIEHLALAFALRGEMSRACVLEGYADALLARIGFERGYTERTTHDRIMALLREHFAMDERVRLLSEGATLAPEAAIALALEES